MSRSLRLSVLLLACFALGPTGSAHAQDGNRFERIQIADSDFLLGETATVSVEGYITQESFGTAPDPIVVVHVKPGVRQCEADGALDEQTSIQRFPESLKAAGLVVAAFSWKPDLAGDYTLCGYINRNGPADSVAVVKLPVVVRAPGATLSATVPAAAFAKPKPLSLSIAVTADYPQILSVERNAAKIPCGPSAPGNAGSPVGANIAVPGQQDSGPGPAPVRPPISVLIDSGTTGGWHICSYLSGSPDDTFPLRTFDGPAYVIGAGCSLKTRTVKGRTKWTARCAGLAGSVTLRAKQGSKTKTKSKTLTLKNGKATFTAAQLKLKRGAKASVTLLFGTERVASRSVRIR